MRAPETRLDRGVWGLAVLMLCAAAALGAALTQWTRAEVRGQSMSPALRAGDRVLVRRGRGAGRGDIVLFRGPDGREVVKRVAGASGDIVDLGAGPQPLGAGEVAVLGDNPPCSTDSRRWGPGPAGAVRGRVVAIYHPPARRARW